MKITDIITEAKLEPDYDFLAQVEEIVDDSLAEYAEFLNDNGLDQQNFFIVCGDRHWQYHAVDSTGVEEFSCGALVDANSRLGRMPGDAAGTDPDGLIKHLHRQTERSGGF